MGYHCGAGGVDASVRQNQEAHDLPVRYAEATVAAGNPGCSSVSGALNAMEAE